MSMLGLDTESRTGTRLAVVLSLISLFLGGWSFISTLQDADQDRRIEQRLACLELPGPNDCGADGR